MKTFKKVIAWRIISIALTYTVTFIYTGDVKSASWFTCILHSVLLTANYTFELLWDKYFT